MTARFNKQPMKIILSALAIVSLVISSGCASADKKGHSHAKGSDCQHPCCVEAKSKGQVCKKGC